MAPQGKTVAKEDMNASSKYRTEEVQRKCKLSEDLAQDKLEWRNRIQADEPNIVRTML